MRFVTIDHGSPLYQQQLALRNEVLRKPLGLDVLSEDIDAEASQWHFGLIDDSGMLVACVVMVPQEDRSARLRQMAVDPRYQRTGLGGELVERVEREMVARGVQRVVLHARIEAVSFYERLGYTSDGDVFIEVTIPHQTMSKPLES